MVTVQAVELLLRIKHGVFDLGDAQMLERISMHDLVSELSEGYPIKFQERRQREKCEVSLAASLRFELACRRSRSGAFPILQLVPVLRNCVFLSGEADAITGVSVATRVMVRPIRKPIHGLILLTGRGFKLDRLPDGWEIKPMPKRAVRLTEDFLCKRGWRFDVLQPLAPRP